MAWLNTLILTKTAVRFYTEYRTRYNPSNPGDPLSSYDSTRYRRKIFLTMERYVGGNETSARALAESLSDDPAYPEAEAIPIAGGQWHVQATKKTEGDWVEV